MDSRILEGTINTTLSSGHPQSLTSKADVSTFVSKLTLSAYKDVSEVNKVRDVTNQSHPGLTMDKQSLKQIRDRLNYNRNVLRVAEIIAAFPRVRLTKTQVSNFLRDKGMSSIRWIEMENK
ncbi:hypothetical protein CHS0354_029503 [Potamilus streckersoni]|uniref:Uncharacterized protein n=1 Tax=Potamilus streckersoni TaxID=2493646 RepID=A0AAE0VRN1_9BIVA|nr:hypothetical protein CHS0354_029503 [Potamilus streckersoni]